MSGRPSWADRARVVRAALGRITRPAITPGQGHAIRNGSFVAAPACGCSCHVFGGSHIVACCGYVAPAPPLQDPDGGRRGD